VHAYALKNTNNYLQLSESQFMHIRLSLLMNQSINQNIFQWPKNSRATTKALTEKQQLEK